MLRVLRTLFAVITGLLLISFVVETLEFGLVTAIHGESITDPSMYYAVRNQGWFLGIKLIYNFIAAVAGGFVTSLIAKYASKQHVIGLAVLQTLSFGWALTQPEVSKWTPLWMWMALIVLSFAGILLGGHFFSRRKNGVIGG